MRMPLVENIPHVYGSGFTFIEQALQGHTSFWLLAALVLLKPLATSFTLGSGNSGGVFAPSLFTGAMLGGAFGYAARALFPEIAGEVGAYALVGMAAVFAAAARAPLTSMLIVFEMSNDYHLILPLMAAGIVASSVAQWLHPESIYTLKLSRKGIRFAQGKDMDIMQGVLVEEVMTQSPVTIHKDRSLSELFAVFQETHLQGFPVLANDEDLFGVVSLQDLERQMHEIEDTDLAHRVSLRDLQVSDVATQEPVTVFPDEPIWGAIRKMAPRDLARLPVVSRHAAQKLVGVISRSDILRAYEVGLVRKQRDLGMQETMALRSSTGVAGVEFVKYTIGPDHVVINRNLAQIPLPPQSNVVSVEREGKVMITNGNTRLQLDDRLTIVCEPAKIDKVLKVLRRKKSRNKGGEQSQ
jgi:CIC family chloride channel protein